MKKLVFASVLTLACAVSMTAYADGCKCGHSHDNDARTEEVKSSHEKNLVYNARRANAVRYMGRKVPRNKVSLKSHAALKIESDVDFILKSIHAVRLKMWKKLKKEGEEGKRVKPKHIDYDFKSHAWVIENLDGTTNRVDGTGSQIERLNRILDKMRNKTIQ